MDLLGKTLNSQYEVIDIISQGSMSTVYRANNIDDNSVVALKIVGRSITSHKADDFLRFRAEIEAVSSINNPSIIKIIDYGTFETPDHLEGLYIAFEYLDWQNLSEITDKKKPLQLNNAIDIIIQICSALEAVHTINIIHGDIKPSNIIINNNSEKAQIKVIDFGLEKIKRQDSSGVTGTLLYMPPEQAGLLRIPVDERSDLYSLGVLFYQLLTGRLPFYSESLVDLLHEQLSQLPLPPSKTNRIIPAVLDTIVLKLLNKEPDNRYQSAAGLKHDLHKLISEDFDFIPGEYDIPDKISANTLFIGREKELKRLIRLCGNKDGQIFCIYGEGGIGKSRIIEKFYQYTVSRGIPFLEGRCYNRSNNIPYSAIQDVLSSYIQLYHHYSKEKQEEISAILRSNLADLGNIIINFNPLLKPLLGTFPEVVPLAPETEKRRLFMIINRFLKSIGEAEGMVIITIEDLHWADTGTVEFLLELAKSLETSSVKILLTYREEELKQRNEIYSILEDILNNIPASSGIQLKPFVQKDIDAFIPGIIKNREEREQLIDFIFQKSNGNPLFTGEIIKYLISEEIFKRQYDSWHIDLERLSVFSIPDSVVDIILKRVSQFSNNEIDLISGAAVIGKKFSYSILSQLSAENFGSIIKEKDIFLTIDLAINRQIIERSNISGNEFVFTHDRIHDAFYNRIKPEDRTELHLSAAKIIEKAGSISDSYIFDLAYHFIQGKDESKIIQYALPAANNARKNYAYKDAIKYYETVKKILDKKIKKSSGKDIRITRLECIEGLAVSYAHTGNVDTSLELFDELIMNTSTPLKKANLYQEMSKASFRKGDLENSENYAHKGLSILGEKMPVSNKAALVSTIREVLGFAINQILPFHLIYRLNSGYKQKIHTLINLYEWLNWVYFFSDSWKTPGTVFRMLNLSARLNKYSTEYALSLYYYGFFCSCMGLYRMAEKALKRSHDLMIKFKDRQGTALCLGGWGFYYIMKGDFKSCIKVSEESIKLLEEIGDFIDISKSAQFFVGGYFLQSYYSPALYYYKKYYKLLNNIFEDMTYSSFAFPCLYYIETEQYDALKELLNKYFPYQQKMRAWFLYFTWLSLYGYCLYEEDKIDESLQYFEKAEKLKKANFFPSHTHFLYQHYAEALISDYQNRCSSMNRKEQKVYLRKIKKICVKAVKHTKTWNHSYDVALRAFTKYYFLKGKHKKAEHHFILSINHSKKINRRYELAKTYYDYALFLQKTDRAKEAKEAFLSSYILFEELGINKYRKSILKILNLQSESKDEFLEHIKKEKTQYTVKKSQELLQITELNDILHETLSVAMTITGASGSHIFLYDEDLQHLTPVISRVLIEGREHDYSMTVVEKVFNSGEVLLTNSAIDDKELADAKSISVGRLKSILCVPLKYNELINGVCYLDNPLARGVFREDDIELLNLYLSNATLAIENKLLHEKLTISDKQENRTSTSDQGEKYVQQAIDYISKNIKEELSRDIIAKKLDINPDYFGKIFKSYTGKSFKEYLNEARVKSTLNKLAGTDEKIIDIAYEAGFESIRTFYRIFFRYMGETPSSYREKRNQN